MWIIHKVHLPKAEFEARFSTQRTALVSNNNTQVSHPSTTIIQLIIWILHLYISLLDNKLLLLISTNVEASWKIFITLQVLRVHTIQIL